MNDKEYYKILSKYIGVGIGEDNYKDVEKELEVRFEFDFQISEILNKIKKLQKYNIEKEVSIVEYHNTERKKTESKRRIIYSYPDKKEISQNKINISKDDFNIQGFPFRISYSHEIKEDFPLVLNPEKRDRKRYIIKDFFNCELHLTIASLSKNDKKIQNHIEIEYQVDKIRSVEDLLTPIKFLFDLLYVKSTELLTDIEIKPIVYEFNQELVILKRSFLKRNELSRKDESNIRDGRLISYEDKPISILKSHINDVKSNNYFVTNKLNGTRYYLYIKSGIFYLVGRTGSIFTTINTFVWKIFETSQFLRDIFILDGEYFNDGKSGILYYTFDIILATNTRKEINLYPYEKRLGYLKQATDLFDKIKTPVKMKNIRFGFDTYKIVEYMKTEFKQEWDYENDGLIYTPAKGIYSDNLIPTLKWKFDHHQSLDVRVKKHNVSDIITQLIKDYKISYIGAKEGKISNELKSIFFKEYNSSNKNINLDNIKITDETMYSITYWKEADLITEEIIKRLDMEPDMITITDATSNVGGNTIGFYNNKIGKVNSVEIDALTCQLLKNNLSVYEYTTENVYCEDYFDVYMNLKQDCIFFDPPWGGPAYKKEKIMSLYLGPVNMKYLIKILLINDKAKLIVLKVPVNYNLEELQSYLYNYKITSIPIYREVRNINKIVYNILFIENNLTNIEHNLYYDCFVSGKDDKLEKFTEYFLYSPEELTDNSIIEVSFDTKIKEFYKLRSRPDKERPNYIKVANDFWEDINNPIPITKLSKQRLTVKNIKDDWDDYRKYSNFEKDKLIRENIDPGSIVIDVGFGKGGDIFKYASQGIKNIIAIEPDVNNIKEFYERYNNKYRINEIDDNSTTIILSIEDKKNKKKYDVEIFLINNSGSNPDIIPIIKKYLNKNSNRQVVATMFFSLTYFFSPNDDFVNLISILMGFNPKKIIGTFMDGEKTKLFINKYEWDEEECGLQLNLTGDNNIYIKILESATVHGHNEYLCDFSRLNNFIEYYQYKLFKKTFYNFNRGNDNLITHFSSLNCCFVFNSVVIQDIYLNYLISNILNYNNKLALQLDSSYFYNCLMNLKNKFTFEIINDKIFYNLFYEKPIYYVYITKKIQDDGKINYYLEKDDIFNENDIDEIRFYFLTGIVDQTFILTYEVPMNDTIKKNIFYNSNATFKLTNIVYDYYFNKEQNDAYQVFNILKENISRLKEYSLIECNIGVGNYTMVFVYLFKDILCIDETALNIDISKYNISLFHNITFDMDKNTYIIKNTPIKFLQKSKNERLDDIINPSSNKNILFVNYQINRYNLPSLNVLKNIKNIELIIILSSTFIFDISEYFIKFTYYKLVNSYVYIIEKNIEDNLLIEGKNESITSEIDILKQKDIYDILKEINIY